MLSQISADVPQALRDALAADRFRPYARVFGGDQKAGARLYMLDVELAGAMLELLRFVEVSLRERMHRALVGIDGDRWFDDPRGILDSRTKKAIRAAKQRLPRQHSSGQVVAELNLGAWTGLLEPGGPIHDSQRNFVRQATYELDLWDVALHEVFRNRWNGVTRADAEGLTKRIRRGRNRVGHHESLVFGVHQPGEITSGGKQRRQTPTGLLKDVRFLQEVLCADLSPRLLTCRHVEELLASDLAVTAFAHAQNNRRRIDWFT